jgi:soluble lytic murein transglycosylase-like protein
MQHTKAQLMQMTRDAARKYGIDENLGLAQIKAESAFRVNANSGQAYGIAQFTPPTAARYNLQDRSDPVASLDAWGRYMRDLLQMFGGRYDLALAGYNSGENRKEYKAAAASNRQVNWNVLPARVQTETRSYVSKILGDVGGAIANAATSAGHYAKEHSEQVVTGGAGALLLGLGLLLLVSKGQK